ncbi:inactive pancreatic lipase-related protein 1-like [Mercenaria mercenaria]|uniref:inactive pancreatic lipase-related protein 1-like n=1 Tax=Mercenaria mercenaria TaxID=6596 RepID=UPI001E1DDC79|nr:inactive pancreatic lipase-related protein 1-like [Mercenaria mercenaria]
MVVSWLVILSAVQFAAANSIQARDTRCYTNLGCFSSYADIPAPQSPDQIATTFRLHVRGTSSSFNLASMHYQSQISGWVTHFDSSKKTKVLIHGYLDSGSTAWMPQMSSELLKKGDFNVIIVDWGHGSKTDYQHAAANTFVVGAETALLLKYLHDDHGLNYADVHVIGHSLGAQTAGHVGHAIPHLGRITGLDPADPGFTGRPLDKRLDASDADFVDVIHTDASKFNLLSGYGTRDAVGDVDFYPNGGDHQPGCAEKPASGAIGSIIQGSIGGVANSITCSHSRSRELFMESINSQCKFYAHTCPSGDAFEAGSCLGCPSGGCPSMGYDADKNNDLRGTYYLSTSGQAPYCGHEYFIDIRMSDRMFHTYGEFIITLVGTNGKSEPLKFESLMHSLDHGDDEKHVISTHTDIGTVTSVQLEYVKSRDLHGVLAAPSVRVHSIVVEPAETSQKTTFCAHEHRFNSGHPQTVTSHTGC